MQWFKSPIPIDITNQIISDEVKFINQQGVVKSKTLKSVENYLFYETKKVEHFTILYFRVKLNGLI